MESVLSLLLACSLHLDDQLLLGVVDAFSHGNPFTVMNTTPNPDLDEQLGLDEPPRSREAGLGAVARIARAGGSPVGGLVPLRPEWLADAGKPDTALFEPCEAVAVASAKLSELDTQCRGAGPTERSPARRACTLDRYGELLGLPALRRFVLLQLARPASASLELLPAEAEGAAALMQPGGIFVEEP